MELSPQNIHNGPLPCILFDSNQLTSFLDLIFPLYLLQNLIPMHSLLLIFYDWWLVKVFSNITKSYWEVFFLKQTTLRKVRLKNCRYFLDLFFAKFISTQRQEISCTSCKLPAFITAASWICKLHGTLNLCSTPWI